MGNEASDISMGKITVAGVVVEQKSQAAPMERSMAERSGWCATDTLGIRDNPLQQQYRRKQRRRGMRKGGAGRKGGVMRSEHSHSMLRGNSHRQHRSHHNRRKATTGERGEKETTQDQDRRSRKAVKRRRTGECRAKPDGRRTAQSSPATSQRTRTRKHRVSFL